MGNKLEGSFVLQLVFARRFARSRPQRVVGRTLVHLGEESVALEQLHYSVLSARDLDRLVQLVRFQLRQER